MKDTKAKIVDLTEKVEELFQANEITTEVIGKLPLIARALENLDALEEQGTNHETLLEDQ